MKYRAEVDGLRAVAILPVIFYHAGFKAFEGGFVGVDVFFVVSGYLITTIILSDMNNNKFSIITFYERRARRIMPALFFVLVCCLPFAWLWLWPTHLKDFSQSLTAVSIFSSNLLFWRESGYFQVASELKPLLHTWSLAVEEQYYVLFPLFLMLLWKLRKRWIFGALMVVGAISLALAQWGAYNKPIATFFLLPTRGWELAVGALIAFYFLYKREHAELIKRYKKTSELLGAVGLLMVCYSVFAFDKNTPFPSLYALVPTVGTGLVIIFATSKTTVGRALSTKFMVGVGLISYSTYLWHQPLFVFARHRSLEEPSTALLLVLSASSIFIAYISWRYVESPFRNKKLISRKAIFTFTIAGSLMFAGLGIAGYTYDGFKNRIDDISVKLSDPILGRLNGCEEEGKGIPGNPTCVIGDLSKNPTIALVGDSHSTRITKELSEKLEKQGLSAVVFAQSWGVPLLNMYTDSSVGKAGKSEFYKAALENVTYENKINKVILFAEWANYTKGMRWGETRPACYKDNYSKKENLAENTAVFNRTLKRTLDMLSKSNKEVLVVGSVPEFELRIDDYLAKQHYFNNSVNLPEKYHIDKEKYDNRNKEVLGAFKIIKEYENVNYLNTYNIFCMNNSCNFIDNDYNVFYQNDGNHLAYAGSLPLVEGILHNLTVLDNK